MPVVLTLDAALACVSAGVVADGAVVAERIEPAERGQSARLAPMVDAVLRQAGRTALQLDMVAVTTGPGSFTGLRAAIALAGGIAFAAGRPLVAVTLADCFAAAFSDPSAWPGPNAWPGSGGRVLWTAIDSRRGRVFLHRGAAFEAAELDSLPDAAAPVALAGDAAAAVAARLVARGEDALLTDLRFPAPLPIAAAALLRFAGTREQRAVQPLYVDPPEAKLPAGGLRPPPRS